MKATRGRDELPCGCAVETDVELHDDTVFIVAERKFYCATHDLRPRLAEAEVVMEQIANRLRVNKETAITDNLTSRERTLLWNSNDHEALSSYEAYKSKHGQVVGT